MKGKIWGGCPEWIKTPWGDAALLSLGISFLFRCCMAAHLRDASPLPVETALVNASLLPLRWLCFLPLPFWFWGCCEEYRKKPIKNSKPWLIPGVLCALSIIGSILIFAVLLPECCFALHYGNRGGWSAKKTLLIDFGVPGGVDMLFYCLAPNFCSPKVTKKHNIPYER